VPIYGGKDGPVRGFARGWGHSHKRKYSALYRLIVEDGVQIVHILDGSRDLTQGWNGPWSKQSMNKLATIIPPRALFLAPSSPCDMSFYHILRGGCFADSERRQPDADFAATVSRGMPAFISIAWPNVRQAALDPLEKGDSLAPEDGDVGLRHASPS